MEILARVILGFVIYFGSSFWVFIVGLGLYYYNRIGDSKGNDRDFMKPDSFHVIDKQKVNDPFTM